jgi:hypothetical protein
MMRTPRQKQREMYRFQLHRIAMALRVNPSELKSLDLCTCFFGGLQRTLFGFRMEWQTPIKTKYHEKTQPTTKF